MYPLEVENVSANSNDSFVATGFIISGLFLQGDLIHAAHGTSNYIPQNVYDKLKDVLDEVLG